MVIQQQLNQIIEVDKEELLSHLKTNKTKHIAEYNQAVEDYKDVVKSALDELYQKTLDSLQNNKDKINEKISSYTKESTNMPHSMKLCEYTSLDMEVPHNYSDSYDEAIDIISWDKRSTIPLAFSNFKKYVRDEWDWTHDFTNMVSGYSLAKSNV